MVRWVLYCPGSFGATPLAVTRYCEAMCRIAEERPDKFFRSTYKPILQAVRERLAQLVRADPEECVIVPNATYGINTILHNFDWEEDDILVSCELVCLLPFLSHASL